MDVAICTDNNYVMPCGITILSLLKNNRKQAINIHVAGTGLSPDNEKLLKDIVDEYDATIKFYNVSKEELEKYKLPSTPPHLSIAAYVRLFLFDILPQNIEKILYLDCDLLIVDDLSDLWDISIDGYSMAGVVDAHSDMKNTFVRLGYDPKYQYINSGVLLMNLKYWREHDVLKQIFIFLENHQGKIKYADQDMLNGALHKSMTTIPFRYNMHSSFVLMQYDAVNYREEIREALRNIAIIHYTSAMKPWLKGCLHPMKDEYLEYKAMSPWKDVPITWGNLGGHKKRRYYKRLILGKLGFKKYRQISLD